MRGLGESVACPGLTALALVGSLGSALVVAPPALAGRVGVHEELDVRGDSQSFSYSALPGEANRVILAVRGRRVVVTDAAGVKPGRGCKRSRRPTRAVCTFRQSINGEDVQNFDSTVRLKDGDDKLGRLSSALAGRVFGGPGADSIAGSSGGDSIDGGTGADSIDGRAGADHLDEGAGGDAGDRLSGGRGFDVVSYAGRKEGVSADLEGDADDGNPGEGDRIHTDVEQLEGGVGDDMLLGGAAREYLLGSAGNDRLTGGGSTDILEAGRGNDVVDGGPGQDGLAGDEGDDLILARDGSAEIAGCADGNDRAEVDELDMVFACEALERDGLAAGVSFLLGGDELDRMTLLGKALETPVGCPRDFAGARCTGDVAITSRGRTAGRRRYSLPRDKSDELLITVSRSLRRRIRRQGAVAVRVSVTTEMPDGSRVVRSTRLVAYRS